MANSSFVEAGSDYRRDIFTEIESDMFCRSSLKIINKNVPLAERTRNFGIRRDEIVGVPRPINGRLGQQSKNLNRSKQDYVICGQD